MGGKREKPKGKMKNRTKFTIFSIFNLVWYTIVVLIASFLNHTVPAELTIAWFSAWTVELALLAGIKVKDKSSDTAKG